ncbi:unnamed protein product, partial [Iphiclides podalirius]
MIAEVITVFYGRLVATVESNWAELTNKWLNPGRHSTRERGARSGHGKHVLSGARAVSPSAGAARRRRGSRSLVGRGRTVGLGFRATTDAGERLASRARFEALRSRRRCARTRRPNAALSTAIELSAGLLLGA